MIPSSTPALTEAPLLIVHPVTGDHWDIGPLLQVMYQLNAREPGQMAELIYDVARYITAEQYSAQDTSHRLRLMLARLNGLATAFDSIEVHSVAPTVTTMRVS